ncbi:MAG TPA: hypothetical protein PLS07_05610, partial [Niabella sp.]|nr:hypothetical protein [Niabella sp.]
EKAPSDLIDQYLSNYNKAKRWTTIWVSILCLLACILIYLFIKNKELMEENAILRAQQAIQSADSATVVAEASLLNTTRTVEILKQQDSLKNYEIQKLNLYNKKIVSLQENQPVQNIDDSIKKIQAKMALVQNNVTNKIPVKPNAAPDASGVGNSSIRKNILVYIQYMPEFNTQKEKVISALGSYRLQTPEAIESISFNSVIKYFNESDKATAFEIAKLVSSAIGSSVDARLINLKAPSRQIEVWLGRYKIENIDVLKRKVNKINNYNKN